ncbi:MAG TPA: hypothetical protein VF759_10560 [Allosphingosinicella sp.]|jgi:hypothetical protein
MTASPESPASPASPASPLNRLVLPPLAPLLVLLPLTVVFVNEALNGAFGWHDAVGDVVGHVENPRMEAMGRTRVLVSLLPFMLVATLLTIQFARDCFGLFDATARRQLAGPILLWLATAALIITLQTAGYASPQAVVGSNFIDDALGGLRASGSGMTLADVLDVLVLLFSAFLTFGAGSAILGTLTCLATPETSDSSADEVWKMQRTRLDGYMYGSALLLVTGLFFMDASMRWPAPFSTDRKLYMEHVNVLMLANGIYYSTIIASYYLPAALWLRRFNPESEAGKSDGSAAPISMAGLLKVFLALISPAVAGMLTPLLETVAK